LPVAIISNGEGLKFTEYSFLANVLAARGYLTFAIQHDLATDAAPSIKADKTDVDREAVYERDAANILFAIDALKQIQPNANYGGGLTLVGHGTGGDISMRFAKLHPDQVSSIVTLDNQHEALSSDGKFSILSFRAKDPAFRTDPGVVPDNDTAEKTGITVVQTAYQHQDMSDRGPDQVKTSIQDMLDKFLSESGTTSGSEPSDFFSALFGSIEAVVLAHRELATLGTIIAVCGPAVALMWRRIADVVSATAKLAAARISRQKKQTARRPQRLHIAGYFSRKSASMSGLGGGLILIAFCYSVLLRDVYLEIFLFILLLAVAIRQLLTAYRANRGYLGTNAGEALELIGFIAKQHRDGGLPPDLRKYLVEDRVENAVAPVQGNTVGGEVR
jgi:pimeloyl-ACP methyl ester carboxylesterase